MKGGEDIRIETQRLLLRCLTPDDAEALHPVFSDTEGTRFTLRVHSAVEETAQWIGAIQTAYARRQMGPLAVVRKHDEQVIGYCGCGMILLNEKKECEIGYRILRSCWGQGFATEAVRETIEDIFERLSVPRIVALIQPDNIASIRVAEKAGMRHDCDTMYEGKQMKVYDIGP